LAADPALDIPSEIGVETTYNYEAGARGKIATLAYDASVYQLDRKDYIGRIAGSYITSDDENESNYDNVGDMRSRGFELALNSDRRAMFSFDLAYTYLDARFTSYSISQQITEDPDGPYRPLTATYERKDLSGNRVPRTSKHMIDFTLHYKPVEEALISAEVYAKSSYYADEANAYKQPGYAVMNLRGEYRFNEMFEIFGRIDNLLNKNYYEFVNINSSALAEMETDATIRVAPPRAYYAGLRIRF
jgi:iron complex outermembrane receptor protein